MAVINIHFLSQFLIWDNNTFDYVPLANYRNCLRETVVDRTACARDTKEQLVLIDGGANDNQGATEIYALLGELLLGQSRSDNSANPPLKTIPAAAFPVR